MMREMNWRNHVASVGRVLIFGLVLAVGSVGLGSPPVAYSAPQPTQSPTVAVQLEMTRNCPENSDVWSVGGKGADMRCINGHLMFTRALHEEDCLTGEHATDFNRVYVPGECGSSSGRGVERIAHSRAIARLNIARAKKHTPVGEVHPDIQWEMYIDKPMKDPPQKVGMRPDIVLYNHSDHSDSISNQVEIIEVKITNGRDSKVTEATDQIRRYTATFPRAFESQEVIAADDETMNSIRGLLHE